MKLQAAFLADAAMVNADGTFMVWRGGVTESLAAAFPTLVRYVMVLRIEADPDEARQLHELRMHIVHGDVEVVPWQTTPLAMREADGQPRLYLNLIVTMQFPVQLPGDGFIEAIIDGDMRLPHLYFAVHATPGAQPA
jgi:hypothetical protein